MCMCFPRPTPTPATTIRWARQEDLELTSDPEGLKEPKEIKNHCFWRGVCKFGWKKSMSLFLLISK